VPRGVEQQVLHDLGQPLPVREHPQPRLDLDLDLGPGHLLLGVADRDGELFPQLDHLWLQHESPRLERGDGDQVCQHLLQPCTLTDIPASTGPGRQRAFRPRAA
jgi:hypothetical protein